MKHRRHKAMRFEKLLWITKGAANRVGFLSNKYTPPRSRGLIACISSRITTVIHVARYHQINYNWFNKHMTTGRINQVTTFLVAFAAPTTRQRLSKDGVHQLWLKDQGRFPRSAFRTQQGTYKLVTGAHGQITLFLDLTSFRHISPCPEDRDHGLRWGLPATGITWKVRTVTADPRVVTWHSGMAIGKQSTSSSHCKQKSQKYYAWLNETTSAQRLLSHNHSPPFQVSISCSTQAHQWLGPKETSPAIVGRRTHGKCTQRQNHLCRLLVQVTPFQPPSIQMLWYIFGLLFQHGHCVNTLWYILRLLFQHFPDCRVHPKL